MLAETFAGTYGVKGKWVRVTSKDMSQDPELAQELIALIQTAYKPIGGHLKLKTPADLRGEITFIVAQDIDKDPQADVTLLGKQKHGKVKATAIGQDGSKRAKQAALAYWGDLLRQGKAYGEVSGPIAHILLTRHHAPIVTSHETVERVLGKRVEWVGEHPGGRYPGVDGWYRRSIGGEKHLKILVGKFRQKKESRRAPMESYLTEFNRMVGVGPSLAEAAAVDPMLTVLAKAFSVKAVKPADVKYLRYRKVGHGVELEDVASKFGDILTSVEPKDADPKALLAFLKKHGAKPAPKVTESLDEAKSGFEIKIIHSKHNPEVVKVEVTGTFRGDEIHGKSDQIHLGLTSMRHGWVTLGDYLRINRPGIGKKVPDGFRTKILKAALAKLVPLAHKIGNKEFAESAIAEAVSKSDLLSGHAFRSSILVNPGSKKVGLAMFKDGVEKAIQITKPASWHEMAKHAGAFKDVGLSFGWVYHRQGQSLKDAGIRADVIKPYLAEVPQGLPAKRAAIKWGRGGHDVEVKDSKGNLWDLVGTSRGIRFQEKGTRRKLKPNEVSRHLTFEPTGKSYMWDMP